MSDSILSWNEVALEANRISHSNGRGEQAGPPLSARALAIVHLAMYDAYAAVTGDPTLPPYLPAGTLPAVLPGSTPEAAITGAAYRALSELFPSQRPFFDFILEGSGHEGSAGYDFGVAVADAILSDRNSDPGPNSTTYEPSLEPGRHRLDPDNPAQGFHAPDYGKMSKGFAISNRHELAAPPFRDAEYEKALDEVRGKGIKSELLGTLPGSDGARTVNQTLIGIFWAYDGAFGLGTPPRLYNQIIRRIAEKRSPGNASTPNSVAENAKLFALVNVAMADAGILAWDQKYKHDFWRPVVGIREHDTSMGPGMSSADDEISEQSDPWWLPLGAPNTNRLAKNFTPPFPAYPSGHATFGAAAFHITRLFYNEGGRHSLGNLTADSLFSGLSFVSEECDGINTDNAGAVRPRHARAFPGGLWQMIEENGRSRVYLGVHWLFDAFAVDEDGEPDLGRKVGEVPLPIGGVPLGLTIAEDIFDQIKNAESTPGQSWKSTVNPR